MEKTISCGIIPYTFNENEPVFFLGHPGGNKTDYWGLLKGEHEGDESFEDTAIREFREESGVDLSEHIEKLVYLGSVEQSSHKTVHAYALYMDNIQSIDPKKCYSNMADGCPWPEITKYAWMSYSASVIKTHKTHKKFYDKILNLTEKTS